MLSQISDSMGRCWFAWPEMLQMFQRDCQFWMFSTTMFECGLDSVVQRARRQFGAKVNNELAAGDRVGQLLRQLGNEVVANKINHRDVTQPFIRTERHLEMRDFGALVTQLLLEMGGQLCQ